MPVTNQWRQKPKVEEPPPPQPQPQPAAGKKATDAEEQAGRKGKFSQASKKDEKLTKAAEAAKQQSDEDEEDNAEEEEESNQPGRIRNLAGFFATQKDDPKNVKKKRFEVADSEETIILENEPERLEGVIRSDDPGEWQKPIELEKGWARNMANIFQNRPLEDSFASKKPFKMDIEEGAQTIVLENEPVILEGVVRSVDKTEDVIGKRGRIKNIAGRFTNPQATDPDDEGGYRKEAIDVDPQRSRNVADMWKQQQYEESTPSGGGGGGGGGGKPKWMLELESAKEYGVFENEPEVRSDVVHADDEQPDVISAQHTRNLRKMWSQIEKEEVKEKEPRRPNIVIRPKKKEPSPEPEPPPPPKPVEEPKATRRFGAAAAPGSVRGNVGAFGSVYGKLAKKEKTPPPPEPEPPPKQAPKRGGFRQAQQPVSPPAAPEPDTKSPFKTSLKPVPRRK